MREVSAHAWWNRYQVDGMLGVAPIMPIGVFNTAADRMCAKRVALWGVTAQMSWQVAEGLGVPVAPMGDALMSAIASRLVHGVRHWCEDSLRSEVLDGSPWVASDDGGFDVQWWADRLGVKPGWVRQRCRSVIQAGLQCGVSGVGVSPTDLTAFLDAAVDRDVGALSVLSGVSYREVDWVVRARYGLVGVPEDDAVTPARV